jgi:hypothetical protein
MAIQQREPTTTLESVLVENKQLKEQIDRLKELIGKLQEQIDISGVSAEMVDEVNRKMSMGLPREDAERVVRNEHLQRSLAVKAA